MGRLLALIWGVTSQGVHCPAGWCSWHPRDFAKEPPGDARLQTDWFPADLSAEDRAPRDPWEVPGRTLIQVSKKKTSWLSRCVAGGGPVAWAWRGVLLPWSETGPRRIEQFRGKLMALRSLDAGGQALPARVGAKTSRVSPTRPHEAPRCPLGLSPFSPGHISSVLCTCPCMYHRYAQTAHPNTHMSTHQGSVRGLRPISSNSPHTPCFILPLAPCSTGPALALWKLFIPNLDLALWT